MWHTRKNVLVPADLAKRLRGNSDIKAVFEAMRPSCQHRYVTWVMEAKRPETRARRVKRVPKMILSYQRRHPQLLGA